MQPVEPSKKSEKPKPKRRDEMIQVWVPSKRMRRPFPLRWGVAAILLFAIYALVTQIQFNRIADDKIYEGQIKTYNLQVDVYNDAVRKNEDCLTSIGTRESYRILFSNVGTIFNKQADLPVQLFPASDIALKYQDEIRQAVISLLIMPVEETLPPKSVQDCPAYPDTRPQPPKRN